MTLYNNLCLKFSNSQLKKLQAVIKNCPELFLKLSSNAISNSVDETTFPHRLLLTNTQALRIRKVFINNSSNNVTSSGTQLYKIRELGKFFGILLEPFPNNGSPLVGNVLTPIVKSALIPFGSCKTTFKSSNEEMSDMMKITKSLKESGLLIEGLSQIMNN